METRSWTIQAAWSRIYVWNSYMLLLTLISLRSRDFIRERNSEGFDWLRILIETPIHVNVPAFWHSQTGQRPSHTILEKSESVRYGWRRSNGENRARCISACRIPHPGKLWIGVGTGLCFLCALRVLSSLQSISWASEVNRIIFYRLIDIQRMIPQPSGHNIGFSNRICPKTPQNQIGNTLELDQRKQQTEGIISGGTSDPLGIHVGITRYQWLGLWNCIHNLPAELKFCFNQIWYALSRRRTQFSLQDATTTKTNLKFKNLCSNQLRD